MKVKEENEQAGLKLKIQKTKITASSSITSHQIEGGKWKQWQILVSCAPKSLQMVTAAMKLKTLVSWRKTVTNLDSILKSRNIAMATMVCLVKAMVFPAVMYRCESWAIKKGEH